MKGKYVPIIEIEIFRNAEQGRIYDALREANLLVPETENIKAWDYIYTLNQMINEGKIEKVEGHIEENFIKGLKIRVNENIRIKRYSKTQGENKMAEVRVSDVRAQIIKKQGNKYLVEYLEGDEKGERELVKASELDIKKQAMEEFVIDIPFIVMTADGKEIEGKGNLTYELEFEMRSWGVKATYVYPRKLTGIGTYEFEDEEKDQDINIDLVGYNIEESWDSTEYAPEIMPTEIQINEKNKTGTLDIRK